MSIAVLIITVFTIGMLADDAQATIDPTTSIDEGAIEASASRVLAGSVVDAGQSPCFGSGDFEYDLIENDSEVRITGYIGSGGSVSIPGIIEGKPVTVIGDSAFAYCTLLTSITFGNSVTDIGAHAFASCPFLTSVTFGNSVTKIGVYTFAQCTSITSITIPDSVTEIGRGVFIDCTSLESVTIGNGVTTIGDYTFRECTSITSITIPDSVTEIGRGVFIDCTSLESVTIPDSVTTIGDYAFRECTSITSITIPDSVTTIGDYSFSDCIALTSITIPDGVLTIGDSAFRECTSFTSITFEGDVPTMGTDWASGHSDSLTVYFNLGKTGFSTPTWQGLPSICISSFDGFEYDLTENDTEVRITGYSGLGGPIVMPGTIAGRPVTTIRFNAFSGIDYLTSITIPDDVTTIGDYAFSDCIALTSITFEGDAPMMGENWAYGHIDSLMVYYYIGSKGFITPEWQGVSSSPFSPFEDFEYDLIENGTEVRITGYRGPGGSVMIPGAIAGRPVMSIGDSAFRECTSLTSLTIPDSVTTIGDSAFRECTSLTSLTIPDSVTEIGGSAFFDCMSLESVTIGNGVTIIERSAFNGCEYLLSITIPDSVTTIGDYAFASCESLMSITFEGDAPSMGLNWTYNYFDCLMVYFNLGRTGFSTPTWQGLPSKRLSSFDGFEYDLIENGTEVRITGYRGPGGSVMIPGAIAGRPVTTIRHYAFIGIDYFTSITIPDSVTTIGDYAFSDCIALTSITIPQSVTTIGVNAFDCCYELRSITFEGEAPSMGLNWAFNCHDCLTVYFYLGRTGFSTPTWQGLPSKRLSSFDGFEYDLIENGTEVRITGYRGPGGSVMIPGAIAGRPVTIIRDHAFYLCGSPTSVTIGPNVMDIGQRAFFGCANLTSVTIGRRVTTIGDMAFMCCDAMTSITIDVSNTNYSSLDGVLYNSSMTELITFSGGKAGSFTIPDSVTTIGMGAFYHCESLMSITIPDGVLTIGYEAFKECISLTYITIPDSVTIVGGSAFRECSALTSMTFEGDAPTVGPEWAHGHNDSLAVYFHQGSSGFTTPIWESLPSFCLNVPDEVEDISAVYAEGRIEVNWTAPSDGNSTITHYIFQRNGTVPIEVEGTSYIDTSIVAGYAYTYNVTAVNAIGNGTTSDDTTVFTVPSVPRSVSSTEGAGYVNLMWEAPEFEGGTTITGYVVFRDDVASFMTTSSRYNDTTVVDGEEYTYYVTAVNTVGESAHSMNVVCHTIPAAPTLGAVPGNGYVNLTWSEPADGGLSITRYDVYRDGSLVSSQTDRWYNDTTVVAGNYYDYTITAVNGVGESAHSADLMGLTVPAKSDSFLATSGPGYVNLTWTAPLDGGSEIDHYDVYRNGTFLGIASGTSYQDYTVDAYTWYSYDVTATNTVGEGPASTMTVFVPDTTEPEVHIISPSNGAVIASTDVTVEWTANDTASGLASFNMTVDEVWYELNASTISLALTLEEGAHMVIVTAYDVAGNHANSTVSFTVAIKPTVINNSPIGDDISFDASIMIEFSEPMDHDSVTVTCGSVSLTPSWGGNVITLTHDPFDAIATYNVTVNGDDTHGNAMDEYTWTFTTEDLVTVTGIVSNGDGPVVNATVTFDSGETTTTDSEGSYTLTTTPGEHTITVTKDRFDTVSQTVTLTTSAVQTFDETLNPTTSSSIPWVGIIVALVVVAAIAFVVYRRR